MRRLSVPLVDTVLHAAPRHSGSAGERGRDWRASPCRRHAEGVLNQKKVPCG